MYSLNTLQKLNAERCKAPARESETTRHCSYCVSIGRSGKKPIKQVVLHSAKHRNTALISGAAATQFLIEVQSTNSDVKRDKVIEAYYAGVPTGKQKLAA